MTYAQTTPPPQVSLSRSGEQIVGWLRELEECRAGGLVTDEDYAVQRAEKFAALLRPTRGLWFASVLGMAAVAAPAGAAIWLLTRDPRYTAVIASLAGTWGIFAVGRALREKSAEAQLAERRKIFVALLENDLLTAGEFADYDDRLASGRQDVI